MKIYLEQTKLVFRYNFPLQEQMSNADVKNMKVVPRCEGIRFVSCD